MILYSNDCPRCRILKAKLDAKFVRYDISADAEKLISLGISSVPVLFVNGEYLLFADAVAWVNRL
jgi:glutaredoxin